MRYSTRRTWSLLLVLIVALFSATVRLPAASCLVTNTRDAVACETACCGNKTCCETSQARSGLPTQPLTKSAVDQLDLGTIPFLIPAPITLSVSSQSPTLPAAELASHIPARQSLLCTFLI